MKSLRTRGPTVVVCLFLLTLRLATPTSSQSITDHLDEDRIDVLNHELEDKIRPRALVTKDAVLSAEDRDDDKLIVFNHELEDKVKPLVLVDKDTVLSAEDRVDDEDKGKPTPPVISNTNTFISGAVNSVLDAVLFVYRMFPDFTNEPVKSMLVYGSIGLLGITIAIFAVPVTLSGFVIFMWLGVAFVKNLFRNWLSTALGDDRMNDFSIDRTSNSIRNPLFRQNSPNMDRTTFPDFLYSPQSEVDTSDYGLLQTFLPTLATDGHNSQTGLASSDQAADVRKVNTGRYNLPSSVITRSHSNDVPQDEAKGRSLYSIFSYLWPSNYDLNSNQMSQNVPYFSNNEVNNDVSLQENHPSFYDDLEDRNVIKYRGLFQSIPDFLSSLFSIRSNTNIPSTPYNTKPDEGNENSFYQFSQNTKVNKGDDRFFQSSDEFPENLRPHKGGDMMYMISESPSLIEGSNIPYKENDVFYTQAGIPLGKLTTKENSRGKTFFESLVTKFREIFDNLITPSTENTISESFRHDKETDDFYRISDIRSDKENDGLYEFYPHRQVIEDNAWLFPGPLMISPRIFNDFNAKFRDIIYKVMGHFWPPAKELVDIQDVLKSSDDIRNRNQVMKKGDYSFQISSYLPNIINPEIISQIMKGSSGLFLSDIFSKVKTKFSPSFFSDFSNNFFSNLKSEKLIQMLKTSMKTLFNVGKFWIQHFPTSSKAVTSYLRKEADAKYSAIFPSQKTAKDRTQNGDKKNTFSLFSIFKRMANKHNTDRLLSLSSNSQLVKKSQGKSRRVKPFSVQDKNAHDTSPNIRGKIKYQLLPAQDKAAVNIQEEVKGNSISTLNKSPEDISMNVQDKANLQLSSASLSTQDKVAEDVSTNTQGKVNMKLFYTKDISRGIQGNTKVNLRSTGNNDAKGTSASTQKDAKLQHFVKSIAAEGTSKGISGNSKVQSAAIKSKAEKETSMGIRNNADILSLNPSRKVVGDTIMVDRESSPKYRPIVIRNKYVSEKKPAKLLPFIFKQLGTKGLGRGLLSVLSGLKTAFNTVPHKKN